MFLKFSEESQKLFLLALKEKNKLNDSCIGTEHLFLAILSMKDSYICKILNENGLFYDNFLSYFNKKDFLKSTNDFVFTPLMMDIINKLSSLNKKEIMINDIVYEVLNCSNSKVNLILRNMNIYIKDIVKKINVNSRKKRNVNKSILNDIGINLNDKCGFDNAILLGRDKEIDNIVEILCCKNKNNPLLIGDAGVGKTAIIEELARRIVKGNIPYQLKNKIIYSISMSSLVAGTKYRGEFEDKINKLILEVESSDDIILFIDEIHTLVGAGGADGAIDASNILKPSLARGTIKIIGATTCEEYKKFFSDDKALSRRFRNIYINEPSCEETRDILLGIKGIYENYHNVKLSSDIIDKIVYYSDKYIKNRKFPDKAIDILDEVCVLSSFSFNDKYKVINSLEKELNDIVVLKNNSLLVDDYKMAKKYSCTEKNILLKLNKFKNKFYKFNNKNIVKDNTLLKVMERKTNIPFYSFKNNYKMYNDKFKKYKELSLFSNNLVSLVKSYYFNFYDNIINNCLGNCLYIESSTGCLNNFFIDELVNYFYLDKNIICIDLNNFRNIDSFLRDSKFLTNVKSNVFSVIIIKNYDNSDNSIKEFFTDILDNGYYLDENNEKISFMSNIFIFSSIGSSSTIGFNKEFNNRECYINVDSFCDSKLVNKINKLKDNINLSNKDLSNLCSKIINSNYSFYNIDFIIRKELSNFNINLKKNRTIRV